MRDGHGSVRFQRFGVPCGSGTEPGRMPTTAVPEPEPVGSWTEVLTVNDVRIIDVFGVPSTDCQVPRDAGPLRLSLLHGGLPGAETLVLAGQIADGSRTTALHRIQVAVPRAVLPFDDLTLAQIVQHPLIPAPQVVDALVRPMLAGMAGRLEELSRVGGVELAHTWKALLMLLGRTLADEPVDDKTDARRQRVRRFVESNLADPRLGPDMVAAALHVSRRRLYQLIERDCEGVAEMIRHTRLRRAAELLRDPFRRHMPIAQVGAAVGLPRPAHFSRLVRAEFGCSPRELRALALAAADGGVVALAGPGTAGSGRTHRADQPQLANTSP